MSKVQFKSSGVLFANNKVVFEDKGGDEGKCCCCNECDHCNASGSHPDCSSNEPGCPDSSCCTPHFMEVVLSGFDGTDTNCIRTNCHVAHNNVSIEVDGTYKLPQDGSCSWRFDQGPSAGNPIGTGKAAPWGNYDRYDAGALGCDPADFSTNCEFDTLTISVQRNSGPDEYEFYVQVDSYECSNLYPHRTLLIGSTLHAGGQPEVKAASADRCDENLSLTASNPGNNQCKHGSPTYFDIATGGTISIDPCGT